MDEKILLSLINRRERQILVHSYIYYEMDKSLISDDTWTKWAFELSRLRDEHPDIYALSEYAAIFRNFDGSTGFDLYSAYMRPEIVNKALYLMRVTYRK